MSSSTVILALWQLRQTWRLLLITGVGILTAVVLVCAVPLYSQVAMTVGIRSALTPTPQENVDIVVRSSSEALNSEEVNGTTNYLDTLFQQILGPYLGSSQFSAQTPIFSVTSIQGAQKNTSPLDLSGVTLELNGASMNSAATHLKLLQGRLPRVNSSFIEMALTSDTASELHVRVGSVITAKISSYDASSDKVFAENLTLPIVGIFELPSTHDPFWHGQDFAYYSNDFANANVYKGLVSNDTLVSVLSKIFGDNLVAFGGRCVLYWYYNLNLSHITVNNLKDVLASIDTIRTATEDNVYLEDRQPFIEDTYTYLPSDIIQRFSSRVSVAQIPLTSLLVLMLGLILFFVSMMTDLLVDRHAEAIAVLRSRGASRRQIFSSLLVQGLGLGLIALLLGPLLAILGVRILAWFTFSSGDFGAFNIITNPLQTAFGLGLFALLAAVVAILVMALSINRALKLDVLAMRREAARSIRHPVWQRLRLDVVAGLVALAAAIFIAYITNTVVLDTRQRLLLLSPLSLIESVFLVIAGMLFFLRLFPLLLRLVTRLAIRSRNAPPVLALAQMARAPRRSMRLTLLLALATAFAIFTLVFTASQAQRIPDVAAYQSGADFSGYLPNSEEVLTAQQLATLEAGYRQLPGVSSFSYGYRTSVTAGTYDNGIRVDFQAVDADTFASTAIWTQQDSTQPLSSLMAQLRAKRASAVAHNILPAIVDANTWNALHLSPGKTFPLNFSIFAYNDGIYFTPIVVAQHIPTPDNPDTPGVIVDFKSFNAIYGKLALNSDDLTVSINYLWLRSKDDPTSIASVRNALHTGDLQLDPLYDRREIITELNNDPIYLAIVGVLVLGAIAAILLALGGNLVASWLSARGRLTNFAILRALGSSPAQVASVLTWEQAIIYTTALALGILFGLFLSVQALPNLVFTSVASAISSKVGSADFYAIQNVPPIQVPIPTSLLVALAALIIICILALTIMVRTVSRPSLNQALRLNED